MDKDFWIPIIKSRCIRYGDFTLHSGIKSTWICDLLVLLPSFPALMLELKPSNFPLVGIEFGGALLVTMAYPTTSGIIRKDGSTYNIPRYKKLTLVDDVVSTESSFLDAKEYLEASGYEIVEYLAILDRRKEENKTLIIRSLITAEDLGLE